MTEKAGLGAESMMSDDVRGPRSVRSAGAGLRSEVDADEVARRCASAMYAADRASAHLGIGIDDVGPGRATARMTVTETMINGHDICHGGYITLLADTAFAFACNTYDRRTVAVGADVSFVAPARLGDALVAVAVERVRRGRSGIYDVTVTRGDDVVAVFRGRSRTVPGTLLPPVGAGS
jgi:phenylacetic acid degradation protein PaaD